MIKIKMRNQTTQLKLKKKLSRHLLKECVKIADRYIIVLDLTFVKKYRNKHDELLLATSRMGTMKKANQ